VVFACVQGPDRCGFFFSFIRIFRSWDASSPRQFIFPFFLDILHRVGNPPPDQLTTAPCRLSIGARFLSPPSSNPIRNFCTVEIFRYLARRPRVLFFLFSGTGTRRLSPPRSTLQCYMRFYPFSFQSVIFLYVSFPPLPYFSVLDYDPRCQPRGADHHYLFSRCVGRHRRKVKFPFFFEPAPCASRVSSFSGSAFISVSPVSS